MTNALSNPTAQAFLLLRIAFTVAPILFGLDKFVGERLGRRRGARRDW
jgi:hypothetical protein